MSLVDLLYLSLAITAANSVGLFVSLCFLVLIARWGDGANKAEASRRNQESIDALLERNELTETTNVLLQQISNSLKSKQ